MTQRNIDDLFALSSSRSNKRSRLNPINTHDRDEFDDLFESDSLAKRKRTNRQTSTTKFTADIFDPLLTAKTKAESQTLSPSLKIKRCISDEDANQTLDDFFKNDTRKKVRRSVVKEESTDILDLFKSKTNLNVPQKSQTVATENFATPSCSKTQKKIKMFFDDDDLKSIREEPNEQNNFKDYVCVKPVLITGGQWLSKQSETKFNRELVRSVERELLNIGDNVLLGNRFYSCVTSLSAAYSITLLVRTIPAFQFC